MILGALFAGRRCSEPLLLSLDAILFTLLALFLSQFMFPKDVFTALYTFLTIGIVVSYRRHFRAKRAACNQDPTSEGQIRFLPASLSTDETSASASASSASVSSLLVLPWLLPVILIVVTVSSMALSNVSNEVVEDELQRYWSKRFLVRFLGWIVAEAYFMVTRVHGDCRGGKPAPTLFVLGLHALAAWSGLKEECTLSLHRQLILGTYFLTGFRKVYCVGLFRWCDGRNLQTMMGVQGLYHDCDERGTNFVLARYRHVCLVGSVAVVVSQLLLPLCLAVDSSGLRKAAFGFAFSFHASNHILWRINFFVAWCPSLLALLVPEPQLSFTETWSVWRSTPLPYFLVALYFIMQFGHALDLATEKCLASVRHRVLLLFSKKEAVRSNKHHSYALIALANDAIRSTFLALLWTAEFHCLGDYYSSYWPTSHPLASSSAPVVCFVVRWADCTECLLPAPTDFYWRRDVSSGVVWPTSARGTCRIRRWVGWSDGKGNSAVLDNLRPATMPTVWDRSVDDVARTLERQLDESFLPRAHRERLGLYLGPGCSSTSTPSKLLLRARVLQAEGTALKPVTLWEYPLG